MEVPISQLPPGDTRLVDAIVNQLKSRGIFDKFRKECLADVDTKPAFQNLRQRVDSHVKKFLGTKTWKNDMNKNQLRDGVRKDIQESGILDAGIEAIISQVVNPKITPLILPFVEDTVYAYLKIEKPQREPEDDHKYGDNQASVHHHQQMQYTQNPMPYHGLPPHLQKNVYSDPPEVGTPKIKPEPKHFESIEVKKEETKEVKTTSEVMPMATDVISSEEDETLLCSNGNEAASAPDTVQLRDDTAPVKMEQDNVVDSFDSVWKDSNAMVAAVEKLSMADSESGVSKSETANQREPTAAFDQQSLDSISSNSSLLSLSPVSAAQRGASAEKTDELSDPNELRSSQSTPLEDEKSVSSDYGRWGGSALPKDVPTADRITIASFGALGAASAGMVVSGASPVSAESQSSVGSSPSKHTAEDAASSLESGVSRPRLTLDQVSTSTSTTGSRPSTPMDHDGNGVDKRQQPSSRRSATSDNKAASTSRHRDHKRKDSKHHRKERRHHSRSKDDHSSYRKKDKYRRDPDDDSDQDKRSSKSRYHGTSSSHHSSSSHHGSSKDRRDKSSSHSSSHKSDRHGKSYRSSHHGSRDSTDKSSKSDSNRERKSNKPAADTKDKSKSSRSNSRDKVAPLKVNGSSSSVSDSMKDLLPTVKKPANSSQQSESISAADTSKSTHSKSSNLKRNGSFTDAKVNPINGTKGDKSIPTKAPDSTKSLTTSKQKKLLPMDDDFTLMGNLNKKKKIILHKKLREPNNNIKATNKSDTIDTTETSPSREVTSPEDKNVAKTEFKNGKKLKAVSSKQNSPKIVSTEENKKIVSTFENGKKLKQKIVPEPVSNGLTATPLKKRVVNTELTPMPLKKRAVNIELTPMPLKKRVVNTELTPKSLDKRVVNSELTPKSSKKRAVNNELAVVTTKKLKASGEQANTPKMIKRNNGLTAASLKRKLCVSLEDISTSLAVTRGKRRKEQKDVVVPPANSQRLLICSFNSEAKVLKQVMLDDSDDGSDFEGFEPVPKQFIDPCDMFAEAAEIVCDFEGFPDSSPAADNRVRSYLARMNHAGNCSTYGQ